MKRITRDNFGDRVVVKTPSDGTPSVVVLRVYDGPADAIANLTPLAALDVARDLIRVAGHVLAEEG